MNQVFAPPPAGELAALGQEAELAGEEPSGSAARRGRTLGALQGGDADDDAPGVPSTRGGEGAAADAVSRFPEPETRAWFLADLVGTAMYIEAALRFEEGE